MIPSNDVVSLSPKKSSKINIRQCNGYSGNGFNHLFRQCYFAKLQDHDALVNPLPSMFGLPECFQTSAGASALQFSTRQDGTWKLAAKGCLETFVAKGKRKLCLECSKYSKLSHRLIKEAADDGVSGIKRTSKVGLLKIASNPEHVKANMDSIRVEKDRVIRNIKRELVKEQLKNKQRGVSGCYNI